MSSKFKVGDRVQFSDHLTSGVGIIVGESPEWEDERFAWTLRAESFDHEAIGFYKNVEDYEFPVRFFAKKDIKQIGTSYQSPVKERVVKEVVAGHYGNVTVYYINPSLKADLRVELTSSKHSASDLRHAARVFNDLAEVLEGKD